MTVLEAAASLEAYTSPGSRLGLERIQTLMHALGDPQDGLRYIHVAGTNGKGSTAAMIAAILSADGYKTGLYTSPALNRFNERIRIDGREIDEVSLVKIVKTVTAHAAVMQDKPTTFELMTAIAFVYFKTMACDFIVLEVGLGGRMDATNIIKETEVSVITQIAKDHTAVLGDTLSKIAGEKAGIIRRQTPVVALEQSEAAMNVVKKACALHDAPLTVVSKTAIHQSVWQVDKQCFDYGVFRQLKIPLLGSFQLINASLAIETISILKTRGYKITETAVKNGLEMVRWPGRFEQMSQKPMFVIDGAHNVNGIKAVLDSLKIYFPNGKATFLIGVMADKDYREMIELILPHAERFICVTPENERALHSHLLQKHISSVFDGSVLEASNVESGVEMALAMGWDTCALGSLYMVGSIRAQFEKT
ncbi:bifunctional folylpolyglutamate synthase/dihydrofolate synthase [Fusibacter paucivorans]|uniref:tetrahydrofolate synthase n=1 Tax=Fusibacter paucivorans TaxID=76009 RepID=A0ABS5PP96_9FIRM|nr:folylpolyglutamate synthase/dihydrofolate synthase family protein [Fusibacter paucivorans]MBS7526990.1 bifunctional folylpolyglutamate synthase/dihydrofolate synthase [Fusibacter paucivorans]